MKPKYLLVYLLLFITHAAIAQTAVFDKVTHILASNSAGYHVVTGDLDGNGLDDVVGVTQIYYDDKKAFKTYIWLQYPSGLSTQPLIFPYTGTCFAIRDLFNDKTADFVVGINGHVLIYSFISGQLKLTYTIPVQRTPLEGLTTGDFDDDGRIDIAACGPLADSFTVIYQPIEMAAGWDVRSYPAITPDYGHFIAGKFGSLTKDALVYVNGINNDAAPPLRVYTFNKDRKQQSMDVLDYTAEPSLRPQLQAATIVSKGEKKPGELWLSRIGGPAPGSEIAIWRGLQNEPDTVLAIYSGAILSANLDCDEDDEQVIVNPYDSFTVVTDSMGTHTNFLSVPYYQNNLAIADLNNDGLNDICIANSIPGGRPPTSSVGGGIWISYNITPPCWPAAVKPLNEDDLSLSVYPSLIADEIQVRIANMAKPGGTLYLLGMDGRIISSQQVTKEETVFNTTQLAGGLYFVRYSNGSRQQTMKVVKQ